MSEQKLKESQGIAWVKLGIASRAVQASQTRFDSAVDDMQRGIVAEYEGRKLSIDDKWKDVLSKFDDMADAQEKLRKALSEVDALRDKEAGA